MRGAGQSQRREVAQEGAEACFLVESRFGRPAVAVSRHHPRPCRPTQLGTVTAEEDERRPISGEAEAGDASLQDIDVPEDHDHRRGEDVVAAGCVVQADVAAHDRHAQLPACLGHPVDRLRELPHHLGSFRVAEVEAVDQGERAGPDAGDVTARLRDSQRRPGPRIDSAIAGVAVGGDGQRVATAAQAKDGGVGLSRPGHRTQEELVVVLPPDPRRVTDPGLTQQPEEVGRRV